MRAPASDLPLVLESVSLQAGAMVLLDRIDLSIAPGAPTLIVGPNGSGKTSLLRLCMGLAAPSSGRVSWGGRVPTHDFLDHPTTPEACAFLRGDLVI